MQSNTCRDSRLYETSGLEVFKIEKNEEEWMMFVH